jgi:hypothetical protein
MEYSKCKFIAPLFKKGATSISYETTPVLGAAKKDRQ